MSHIQPISYHDINGLNLARFKEMDSYTVEGYDFPIELIMENFGIQITTQISDFTATSYTTQRGVGNGNKSGGDLLTTSGLANLDVDKAVYEKFVPHFPPFNKRTILKFES